MWGHVNNLTSIGKAVITDNEKLYLPIDDENYSYPNQNVTYSNLAKFGYNAQGIRTKKVVFNGKVLEGAETENGNRVTKYYYAEDKLLAESRYTPKSDVYVSTQSLPMDEIDGGPYPTYNNNRQDITYLYGINGITGFTLKQNGIEKTYYYRKNLQGDVTQIYEDTGLIGGTQNKELVAQYYYDAWGNHTIECYENNLILTYSSKQGYDTDDLEDWHNYIGIINPIRYRSYYFDQETNLYYLKSRYYDPQAGRFINQDDINVAEKYKDVIGGLNLFAYCNNNPIMNTDENGQGWFDWLWKIIVGVVIIAALVVGTIFTAVKRI